MAPATPPQSVQTLRMRCSSVRSMSGVTRMLPPEGASSGSTISKRLTNASLRRMARFSPFRRIARPRPSAWNSIALAARLPRNQARSHTAAPPRPASRQAVNVVAIDSPIQARRIPAARNGVAINAPPSQAGRRSIDTLTVPAAPKWASAQASRSCRRSQRNSTGHIGS